MLDMEARSQDAVQRPAALNCPADRLCLEILPNFYEQNITFYAQLVRLDLMILPSAVCTARVVRNRLPCVRILYVHQLCNIPLHKQ